MDRDESAARCTDVKLAPSRPPITVSTLKEAEQFFEAGYRDILYAVGFAPDKQARAKKLMAHGAELTVITDSIETAEMLIEAGVGVKAPYFHRSWINLPWGTSEDELRHRLRASYRLVRASLTKKVQAQLDPLE